MTFEEKKAKLSEISESIENIKANLLLVEDIDYESDEEWMAFHLAFCSIDTLETYMQIVERYTLLK